MNPNPIIILASVLWTMSAIAQEPVVVRSVDVVDYGIYRIELTGQNVPMPSAGAGAVQPASRVVLVAKTNEVPATIGTTFGFQFILKGTPVGGVAVVDIIVEHPAFKKPDGEITRTSDKVPWPYRIGETVGYTYTFDHDWEAVTGVWKIQVWQGGKIFASKEFIVKAGVK
jgi:hypothetical protein